MRVNVRTAGRDVREVIVARSRRLGELWRSEWKPNAAILGGTSFGWNVVGALVALLGVAALTSFVYSSYFGVDVAESIAYVGAELNCTDPDGLRLGVHCFSDYSALHFATLTSAPTLGESFYPVSTRLLRLPFFLVDTLAGSKVGGVFYLVVSALCVLLPLVWCVRRAPVWAKALVVAAAGLATTPFLFVWDRGNILALAVPFLFLTLYGLSRDRPWLAVVGIIAASSIKPQFALLALALAAIRSWKHAVVAVVGSLAIFGLSYLLLGANAVASAVQWASLVLGWSSNHDPASNWPTNASFAHALYTLVHVGPWPGDSTLEAIPDRLYTVVAVALVLLVLVLITIAGRRLPPLMIGASLLAIVSLSLPISFGYYLVFAIIVFAFAFRDGLAGWLSDGPLGKALIATFGLALVLSLTPLLLPLGPRPVAPPDTLVLASLLPVAAAWTWAAFLALVAIWSVAQLRSRVRPGFEGPG